jgi:high-affinity nickel-transport protein
MNPIGDLFGLGFDTATEVALLVLSSTAVVSGLPFYAVLSLPLLFAAGMSFFDLLDGCFMNFAYGWAFSSPMRKIYYNLVITGLSVGVAVLIGAVEVSSLIGQELNFSGPVFSSLQGLNINTMGFVVVGVFAITWAGALAYWKLGRVEERWESDAARARFEAALTPGDDRLAQRNSADGKGSLPIAEPALARPGF